MLTAIAIVPSAPVLVPDLAGAAAAELDDLRHAVFAAAATLPSRWTAVGVGPADSVVSPHCTATFAGYGVDLRVALSRSAALVQDAPLCALMAAWIRGEVNPGAVADVRVFCRDHDDDAAIRHGTALRDEIEADPEPLGVLVVADGAHTLTPAAPGGHDPESVRVQEALDDALATGDTAALAEVPASVPSRVVWHVLAGFAGTGPRSAQEFFRGAPYGVGYFAGVWQP